MIRRFQLLDEESRSSGNRLVAIAERIRDGLLRDNKVVPAVLGFLALLIFAWLIAGAVMGGSGEEERASNQSSLAQGEDSSESGSSETPAPEVENRDTDSYSAFESKDPFRNIIAEGGANNNQPSTAQSGGTQGSSSRPSSSRPGGGRPSSDRPGGGAGARDNGEDSSGQSPSGSPNSGRPGTGQDGGAQPGAPQGGAGDLFNSGGDLPPQ